MAGDFRGKQGFQQAVDHWRTFLQLLDFNATGYMYFDNNNQFATSKLACHTFLLFQLLMQLKP